MVLEAGGAHTGLSTNLFVDPLLHCHDQYLHSQRIRNIWLLTVSFARSIEPFLQVASQQQQLLLVVNITLFQLWNQARLPKLGFVIQEEKNGKLLVEKKIRKLAPEPTFLCLFSAPTISELDMNHIDPSSKKLYFRHSKLDGDWCLLWLWCWCKTYLFVQLLVCTFVCCIFVMCSSSLMQLFVFSLFCTCFVCCSCLFVRLFVYIVIYCCLVCFSYTGNGCGFRPLDP